MVNGPHSAAVNHCYIIFIMAPIGVFDSGYGGLTILREFRRILPRYDFIYLGDNARAPYGSRSFDVVFDFTCQAVEALFARGCRLVILACNTASAKALRSIQQTVLPHRYPGRRVLGVIRPTVEAVGEITESRHVALLATPGTVNSHSYRLELEKIQPGLSLTETACPMWVPIIEAGEAESQGADWFVKKYIDLTLRADPEIDTILLGCTHYPLLLPKIEAATPPGIKIVPQGQIVAESLADYLRRHPEIDSECSKSDTGNIEFLTTENPDNFDSLASIFMGSPVSSSHIRL